MTTRMPRLATTSEPMLSVPALAAVLILSAGFAGNALTRGVPSDLFLKARDRGTVRVVVELRIASASPDAASIASVRDAVLRSLAGTPHRVVRVYQALPFLALEVSPEALAVLASSPHVASVAEDAVAAPLVKPGEAEKGPSR